MLKVTVLGLGLLAGSLFAQGNTHVISNNMTRDYQVQISTKENLKVGDNQLKVNTKYKAQNYNGMDVDLTIYTPDNKELYYKHVSSGEYFNTNLPIKGDYGYSVRFSSSIGSVSHYSRGSFSL